MKVRELNCSTARQQELLLPLAHITRPDVTPHHPDAVLTVREGAQ
jgi:hypothetical protein